ncbi:hypothetical protein CHD73_23980 (plasmid) [Salmonella enterica subsp. enterica serovar Manhattan]|nr:hypothetical protein CHD73_23980 [Salmonella enterica subsp. enterica serovar Manhattan]
MGFFLGAAPETSLSVLARFDELRLRFDLPVLLSVSRKSFLRALTGRGPGDVGPRHSLQSLPPPQVELTSSAHTSRAPCATGWRYWRR